MPIAHKDHDPLINMQPLKQASQRWQLVVGVAVPCQHMEKQLSSVLLVHVEPATWLRCVFCPLLHISETSMSSPILQTDEGLPTPKIQNPEPFQSFLGLYYNKNVKFSSNKDPDIVRTTSDMNLVSVDRAFRGFD